MLLLAQILAVIGIILFTTMPVVFAVFGLRYLLTGKQGRGVVVTGCFILGALTGGFLVWQMVPANWTLPFWTTIEATVDSETYGHDVEHYAEGIVLALIAAAIVGGVVFAGAAALAQWLRQRFVHT